MRLIGVAARQGNAERGLLREQVRPSLRERQIRTGRMHGEPAVRDGGSHGDAIFLIAATGISKLPVDDGDRQPPRMIGLYRVRQLKQFLLGGVGRSERAVLLEFHLPCLHHIRRALPSWPLWHIDTRSRCHSRS
jgi:hypothetical protein